MIQNIIAWDNIKDSSNNEKIVPKFNLRSISDVSAKLTNTYTRAKLNSTNVNRSVVKLS